MTSPSVSPVDFAARLKSLAALGGSAIVTFRFRSTRRIYCKSPSKCKGR